jgi:N-dimethylarginine dimethylaminohydrolase
VWDGARNQFWMGYGPRSDAAARPIVEALCGVEAIALELADPRFYHLDTALCPLSGGDLIYLPSAFTAPALAAIRQRVPPRQRIEIGIEDASRLAANAVCIDDTVVMSACGEALRDRLQERGYRVVVTPLEAFLRSGGAAFCLTLRLDGRSAARRLSAAVSTAA